MLSSPSGSTSSNPNNLFPGLSDVAGIQRRGQFRQIGLRMFRAKYVERKLGYGNCMDQTYRNLGSSQIEHVGKEFKRLTVQSH